MADTPFNHSQPAPAIEPPTDRRCARAAERRPSAALTNSANDDPSKRAALTVASQYGLLPNRRSGKARQVWLHLVEDEQDVLRRKA